MMKQYWKEIIALLLVKSILLTGLWFFAFRNPLELSNQQIGNHLFATQKNIKLYPIKSN